MQTGPDPHSVKFDKATFQTIANYFTENSKLESFQLEQIPATVPKDIILQMKKAGFLEFRNEGQYKLFFCGYGVVGKGWGFILGEFDDEQVKQPSLIKNKDLNIHLTYLERLGDNWYRFAAD